MGPLGNYGIIFYMDMIKWLFYGGAVLFALVRVMLIVRQMRYVWRWRNDVPAAFVTQVEPLQQVRAAEYTQAKSRLALWQVALELVLLWLATGLGGLERGSQMLKSLSVGPLWQGVLLLVGLMLFVSLVELPLDLYRKFGVETRFGFNTARWRDVLRDMVLQALLGLILGVPLIFSVLWTMQRMGQYWWWYVWLLWVGFNVSLMAVYPVWIAPLFNRFSPLPEGEVKARINQLLQQCKFAAGGLYVMDGSRRSRHGNAFFTGFGRNRRIVLFDTLLQHLQPLEIEAVLAHELGHFYHRHVIGRMVGIFVISLLLLWGVAQAMSHAAVFAALHLGQPNAASALAVLLLALPVFSLPVQILTGISSRRQEFQADTYAAEQVGAQALIDALVHLYRDNATSLHSDPWYSLCFDSHPNAQQRVAHLQLLVHQLVHQ